MAVDMARLMRATIEQRGSDLHLNVGKRPILRVNGSFVTVKSDEITPELMTGLMQSVAPDQARVMLESRGSVDFSLALDDARFRVNVCRSDGSYKITLRRLPSTILTPEQCGYPSQFAQLFRRPRGLLLVTGPTGSGKTTTLASGVTMLTKLGHRHIIMLEEPTEYKIGHGICLVTQREVGRDLPSFHQGVMDALREDPDVIVIGEMRGLETIRAALTAAETGHLVVATLHTSSAATTVHRIIDGFPADEQSEVKAKISTTLIGVLCQQLVRRKDGTGRVGAFEFLRVDKAVGNLIRTNKVHQIESHIQTNGKHGMRLLDEHLIELLRQDVIDEEDAIDKANDPERVREGIERMRREEE